MEPICAFMLAICKDIRYTTGNRHFAECQRLCRVYFIGHSANTVFAECQIKYTRQKKNTRQNASLPSAFFLALGKDVFCRVLFFGTWQNASLPSAFFWHSTKMYFAECLCFGTQQRGILPCAFFWWGKSVFQSNF